MKDYWLVIDPETMHIEICFPDREKYNINACLATINRSEIERILEIFEIACLLHDLGHAPFSHTGEEYYLEKGKRDLLHGRS